MKFKNARTAVAAVAFAALAAGCWLLWRRIQTEGVKCWEEF